MRLIDVLVAEHRGFTVMLDVLEAAALRLQAGQAVPDDMLTGLLDFFEHSTDGHHHQEEQLLFPLLATHGVGRDQSVVHALLAQHEAGRMYTAKMRADLAALFAGSPSGRDALVSHARGYVELIREHIRIEDSYFYGIAEEALSLAERDAVSDAFAVSSGRRVPEEERGRYLVMMETYPAIAAQWRLESPTA